MSTLTFTLRGDQIGRFDSASGTGNGLDRVVTLTGVRALGGPGDLYTVTVDQVSSGQDQLTNGQFITIRDSTGHVILQHVNVMPDIEQNLGGGDEHLILEDNRIVIDVGGLPATPTTTTYGAASEVASQGLGDNDGELDFADLRTNFPCFATGSLIATPTGERAVEDLREGDLVETLDTGPQPIRWLRARSRTLAGPGDPHRPIIMAKDAFGPGTPHGALVVSPQHRILARVAGQEVLVPAKALLPCCGVRVGRGLRQVRYVSILTARHQIIRANGLWCETFYPGPHMLATMPADLCADLRRLIPLIGLNTGLAYGPPARALWTVGQARARGVTVGRQPVPA